MDREAGTDGTSWPGETLRTGEALRPSEALGAAIPGQTRSAFEAALSGQALVAADLAHAAPVLSIPGIPMAVSLDDTSIAGLITLLGEIGVSSDGWSEMNARTGRARRTLRTGPTGSVFSSTADAAIGESAAQHCSDCTSIPSVSARLTA